LRSPANEWIERLREWKPRLVHAHFGYDGFLALPLARRLGIPILVTFHGYDATLRSPASPAQAVYLVMRKRVFRKADRVVAVSSFIRDEVIRAGCPADKVTVRYIGVDVDRFKPAGSREPLILFVGRLVEKKGCADLIDAMEDVIRAVPEAELVIVGDGPLRPDLQARAVSRGSSIRFLGHRSHDEVRAWLRRASVLCAPSRRTATGEAEGLPMAIIEALASGTPVVATRHAGIPEAVEHGRTGWLVEEGATGALAQALTRTLQDRDRWDEMSRLARERAVLHFSLARCTASLEDLYDEISGCD
jgi:glycosyltransferase involved in cell wall biosynthesis